MRHGDLPPRPRRGEGDPSPSFPGPERGGERDLPSDPRAGNEPCHPPAETWEGEDQPCPPRASAAGATPHAPPLLPGPEGATPPQPPPTSDRGKPPRPGSAPTSFRHRGGDGGCGSCSEAPPRPRAATRKRKPPHPRARGARPSAPAQSPRPARTPPRGCPQRCRSRRPRPPHRLPPQRRAGPLLLPESGALRPARGEAAARMAATIFVRHRKRHPRGAGPLGGPGARGPAGDGGAEAAPPRQVSGTVGRGLPPLRRQWCPARPGGRTVGAGGAVPPCAGFR